MSCQTIVETFVCWNLISTHKYVYRCTSSISFFRDVRSKIRSYLDCTATYATPHRTIVFNRGTTIPFVYDSRKRDKKCRFSITRQRHMKIYLRLFFFSNHANVLSPEGCFTLCLGSDEMLFTILAKQFTIHKNQRHKFKSKWERDLRDFHFKALDVLSEHKSNGVNRDWSGNVN